MKKLVVPIMILMALALAACGQSPERLNNNGNEAFLNGEYETALAAYQQAGADSPELAEPAYRLGINVMYYTFNQYHRIHFEK